MYSAEMGLKKDWERCGMLQNDCNRQKLFKNDESNEQNY